MESCIAILPCLVPAPTRLFPSFQALVDIVVELFDMIFEGMSLLVRGDRD